jgi:hypothetical protein
MYFNRSYVFEGLVVALFIPIMWMGSFVLAVGSSGELGCVFADACRQPWTSDKRVMFFILLFAPPLLIWTIWGIVAWIIHEFSSPS